MLTRFGIGHFKSYDGEAVLAFGQASPLTVIIGANASGKSNLIEGLRLLSTIAGGARLDTIRPGQEGASLRGNLPGLGFGGSRDFSFHCWTDFEDYDRYGITLELRDGDRLHIKDERIEGASKVPLFEVVFPASGVTSDIEVAYDNFARGGKKPQVRCTDQMSVLAQLQSPARFQATHRKAQKTVTEFTHRYQKLLENITFLDPRPKEMRGYSFHNEDSLSEYGNNLSGVLYNLCRTNEMKERVLEFVRDLPEQNIEDIRFIETPRGEVMVALMETFGGSATVYDASQLSDGTLRILAVASAVLSAPEGGMVVVEEIDNGVHPSRVEMLLERIAPIAKDRRLQILITTHNPALLDALPRAAVPQVVFCYRDEKFGSSRLIRLEDIPDYPKLVIQGPLGRLLTTRALDSFVKHRPSTDEQGGLLPGLKNTCATCEGTGMANIVIVDTSILLNILNVPLKNDQRPEVAERLNDHIRKGDQLFLPIATVLETGNHIAQNGDGNQKRQCALKFVETVRLAVTDSIPWALAPLPDNETLVSWLDDFPDSAGRGVGIGDHSILKAWKQTCDDFPGAGVSVWSLDGHLQGHDRKPWQA